MWAPVSRSSPLTQKRTAMGKFSVLNAAAKASKDTEAPIPAVDEETLSLSTAAKCGECHKQIYEEWSSSQHAYASISPMFHKFEQKFTGAARRVRSAPSACAATSRSAPSSARAAKRRSGRAARSRARA